MKIAVQEDMLPGSTILEKFEQAEALGIDGIEFWGRGLKHKVDAIAEAMTRSKTVAASVNHGRQGRFLDPSPTERDRALAELRDSITCAADIRAKGVIFVPHFAGPILPDLSPWKSPDELQAELLIMHLRTLEDYAMALDVELYVEPVNRYETHFLNRLEQAAAIAARLNHPHVRIVADLFHMALEEDDPAAAIRAQAQYVGHVHLADSNRRLPGQGTTDFASAAAALRDIGYDGWAAFECGRPGENASAAARYRDDLPASLDLLRRAGF